MTYGWAILIIAIVIATLYMWTQGQRTVQMCEMSPGFACNNPLPMVYYDSNTKTNNLSITLQNGQGRAIIISNISCTTTLPNEANKSHVDSGSITLPKTIQSGTSEIFKAIPCKKIAGATATNVSILAGQQFAGYFIIWYNFEDDPDTSINRMIYATIRDVVLKA